MTARPRAVLDASAFLAYLQRERGSAEVRDALRKHAAMSAVNWAEVLSKLADAGHDPETASRRLREQGIVGKVLLIVPFDERLARDTAGLRTMTRPPGLSLGNRACLALALSLKVPVLTAGSDWSQAGIRPWIRDAIRMIRSPAPKARRTSAAS